jgi:O-antigen ligase
MRLTLEALKALRPWPVYLLAAALPFSLAAVNVSKLLLVVTGLSVIGLGQSNKNHINLLGKFMTVKWILLMLGLLAMSLTYTSAPMQTALLGWAKYAKLIVFLLPLLTIRREREARTAITILLIAQTFVMFTTYLMSWGWQVPWVPADRFSPERTQGSKSDYAAYSSYLDQSLMTAGYAVLCWHLRDKFPDPLGKKIPIVLSIFAIFTVFFVLLGRSGQVAMLAVILLSLLWYVERKRRLYVLLASVLIITTAVAVPSAFKDRMSLVISEANSYFDQTEAETSTGIRLNLWLRATQAIAERPLTGYGVASFDHEYRRLEASSGTSTDASAIHNAHQEYLQWGVQLGFGGVALMLGLIVVMIKDAQQLAYPARWATQSLVTIFAIACLFNCALFDALIGDYFCFTIGLLLTYGAMKPDPETSRTIAV